MTKKAILGSTTHTQPWSRRATAAENRSACHSRRLRTENRAYNMHGLDKVGQQKTGEYCLVMMSQL